MFLIDSTVGGNHGALDITYHQRPRPTPEKPYDKIRAYFPDIEGRTFEAAPPKTAAKKKSKPWQIEIADALATGSQYKCWR